MSKYTYRVTEPRFHNNVLYKPGERDIIVTDTEIKSGVVLVSQTEAAKAVDKQRGQLTKKQQQAAESKGEVAKFTGTPDFSGKTSNVVTL